MKNIELSDYTKRLVIIAGEIGTASGGLLTAEKLMVAIMDVAVGLKSDGDVAFQMAISNVADLYHIDAKQRNYYMHCIDNNPDEQDSHLYMAWIMLQIYNEAFAKGEATISLVEIIEMLLKYPSTSFKALRSYNPDTERLGDLLKRAYMEPSMSPQRRESLRKIMDEKEEAEWLSVRKEMREKRAGRMAQETEVNECFPAEDELQGAEYVSSLARKVKEMTRQISKEVLGQEKAIGVFASGYFRSMLRSKAGLSSQGPAGVYLFAGPPGVGKTLLAETIAKRLEVPFKRFDMSEYCDKEANVEFCGSDKVYKNGKEGNFTSFVSQNPVSVVLFDEIEKAHLTIIHLFLHMLDIGKIRDNYTDKELPLDKVIMIFTTNAGKQLYEDSVCGNFSHISRKVILNALKKDKNPETGEPYFPAAICSRFAAGNVVMFNHISAHTLRKIACKEINRITDNLGKAIDMEIHIDENVYTALLLAESSSIDARMMRARAETFINDELFEVFRIRKLMSPESPGKIRSIDIGVTIPSDKPEIINLFHNNIKPRVLVYGSETVREFCTGDNLDFVPVYADSTEAVQELIRENNIQAAWVDIGYGLREDKDFLSKEDIDSEGRDFFNYVRLNYVDMPVYLFRTEGFSINDDEEEILLTKGVSGFINMCGGEEAFRRETQEISDILHRQNTVLELARSNKILSFESSQRYDEDTGTVHIDLYDLKLITAVDSEDADNVLSNISRPTEKFKDVIGADNAKEELEFFAQYLRDPARFIKTGAGTPRGILLYGPPGTGKTMLAKAMAGETNVTFIAAEGNQFLKRELGEGPAKVHELFRVARKYAPSILFVDEIDSIARARVGVGSAEDVLTAFLAEMDGFKTDVTKPVFVLAATNFDVEPGSPRSLDGALLRRFNTRIMVDLPKRSDRELYMKQKLEENKCFALSPEELENLAVRSAGMSLAELKSVFELALRKLIRMGAEVVTDHIMEDAFEEFRSGSERQLDVSYLRRTARHEAGHAFLAWISGDKPAYITVSSRANHAGYVQTGDKEDKAVHTLPELRSMIRMALGGRAAEVVFYGPEEGVATGAVSDLAFATSLATDIVCRYGMDPDFGLATINPSHDGEPRISAELREAVNKILATELEAALKLITENREAIDKLADTLLDKIHLGEKEIDQLFSEFTK